MAIHSPPQAFFERKRLKPLTLFVFILFSSFSLSADPKNTPPNVVVTNTIIGDWVKYIAGDTVDLYILVGPDTDMHTFEPTPKDAVALSHADLIFENGLDLEFWLPKLYASSNTHAKRIALAKDLPLLRLDAHHTTCPHHHGCEFDPHIWLSVDNAIKIVQLINTTLAQFDPRNKMLYSKNTQDYIQRLQSLDKWVFQQVETIPSHNRKLVTNHDSFRYFAHRYGFTVLGSILDSASTETADPSASQFAKLVSRVKKNKVPAIFAENVQNTALATKLAEETGLLEPQILYTEALSGPNQPAHSYEALIRYNVSVIVKSLK